MDRDLVDKIIEYKGEDYLALATVISATGSSPRNSGAQILVYPNGSIYGTVGGGLSEAETIKKAQELIQIGESKKYSFDMSNDQVAKAGGVCGGQVEIFIETIKVSN
ncbi:xanthine and CO dehydrogenases maturation factor, XdhC/CoxF family [Halobacteroides halobius DSM 5150]|uniref:Xanthine and CO dehydrogenases maturation factor, XdhC/CoxF family n=1 Tax=Halobacteroides halobius (strain ATCC 35273 / DSM 5150 / MD-1) TaxID=748449 RepID=L0K9H9_HALHC|nr:XdhC family protein [Halobacteroides halobius]AGB41019.1 xanthine and CO dehydrogenases maturation factor, XdhC/CoxF family [Halobacteroides halobius DSM 5150]